MLPSSGPSGMLVPFMSAARRHQVLDTAFEMVGGTDKLVAEIEKDSAAYWEFMKLWGKGLPKMSAEQHNVGPGVEDLLEQMHARREARMVDITPVDNSKEPRYGAQLNSKGPTDADDS